MGRLNCQRSLSMLLVYLLSNWIPPVFSGEKHFAQLLYGRPLFVQHFLAEVGLQNLVMGLDCVGQGVRPLYGLQRAVVSKFALLIHTVTEFPQFCKKFQLLQR